ncbi:MAG: hypothetical protein ACJ8MH_07740, partial [Povalibacter sp.]
SYPSAATSSSTPIVDRAAEKSSAYSALCVALLVLASVPLVLSVFPPFIDYPFHLARIDMLSHWSTSAFIREHYEIPSLVLPNLSLEILMLPLSKLMPTEWAGVVFIATTFALMLSGTVVLHRVLFGTRSLWPLVAAAWLYNWIVFYGFLNYVFGVSVMLWCLIAWLRMSEREGWMRLLVGTALALFLFFCHLIAFILYAFAIAGYELQRSILSWRQSGRSSLSNLLIGAAPFIPAVIVYFYVSPTRSAAKHALIYDLFSKFSSVIVNLTSGNLFVDGLTLLLLVAAAALVIRGSAKIEVSTRFIGAFIGIAVAFLIAPLTIEHPGPAYLDVRMPVALLFTAIAMTRLTFKTPKMARWAAGIFGLYFLIKIAVLSASATQYKQLVLEHLSAFDHMQPKSTLFAVRQRIDDTFYRRFYVDRLQAPGHINALAAIRREVFVPAIYTVPGGQPIAVRERFAAVKKAQGDQPVWVRDAGELDELIAKFAKLHREASPGQAAYVLMQDRAGALPLPAGVEVVATGPGFRLVKIVNAQP